MGGALSAKARVAAAANGFRRLAANLRKVASGEVVDRVLGEVTAQISAVARTKIGRHTETGYAASNTIVVRDAKAIELRFPKYLDFHGWWPFAKGLPKFIVANASKRLAALTTAAITGGGVAGVERVLELEAAEREAKKANRRAAARRRAEDRKLEQRTRAREARE